MKFLQILVLGFLLFALKLPILAQESSSTILTGRILELQGAVIPNLEVKATSWKNIKYETRTNEDGVYSLKLPDGLYTFEVNAEQIKTNAFETFKLKNYRIVPAYDGKINLDVSLSVINGGLVGVLTIESPKINKTKTNKKEKNKSKRKNKNNK